MKIVVDEKIPFLKGALESKAEVVYLPPQSIDRACVADADALIIRTRTKCDDALLSGSKVKFIATATIGYDHIDTEYCRSAGITWVNAPGCNAGSVTQYIMAAILNVCRRFSMDPSQKTIGVVGVGNVGAKVAGMASILGMKVLLSDPPRARAEGNRGFTPIDELLSISDIVTFHVPLTHTGLDATMSMINHELLGMMKPNGILFNTSRGEVACTSDLKKAIKTGRILGAVIDVWEGEPDIDRELLDLVLIGTPHIAGYSVDGKAKATVMAVQAASEFFHLGIEDWVSECLPPPRRPFLEINGGGKRPLDILSESVEATYDIMVDDAALRANPGGFEMLRGAYPPRREFYAHTVKVTECPNKAVNLLAEFGFKIKSGHTVQGNS